MLNKNIRLAFACVGIAIVGMTTGAVAQTDNPPLPPAVLPMGFPQPTQIAPTGPLKYREQTSPLTIGEMSSLQAQKLEDDFLAKLGYTSAKPARVAVAEKVVKPKPVVKVATLAIYGATGNLRADVLVNGEVFSVKSGTALPASIMVESISTKGVSLGHPGPKRNKGHISVLVPAGNRVDLPV